VPDDSKPVLYTSEQTAEMLIISTKTLREFGRAGDIAYVHLRTGRRKLHVGFHIDDINDFIKAGELARVRLQAKEQPEWPFRLPSRRCTISWLYGDSEPPRSRSLGKDRA
jgi:hypothetical protein